MGVYKHANYPPARSAAHPSPAQINSGHGRGDYCYMIGEGWAFNPLRGLYTFNLFISFLTPPRHPFIHQLNLVSLRLGLDFSSIAWIASAHSRTQHDRDLPVTRVLFVLTEAFSFTFAFAYISMHFHLHSL